MGSAYSCRVLGCFVLFVSFFLSFLFHRAQSFFSKKVNFTLGTPLKVIADTAAADLVLSLHLNKHSCLDWHPPVSGFCGTCIGKALIAAAQMLMLSVKSAPRENAVENPTLLIRANLQMF